MKDRLRLEVASPCPASWEVMSGDAQRRFCASCQKHVYDLSGLTRDEIDALLLAHEGRLCVRFFQRADGTVLTADCPVGLRERATRLGRQVRAAWGAAIAAALAVLGLAMPDGERPAALPPIPRVAIAPPPAPPQIPPLPDHPRVSGRVTREISVITGESTAELQRHRHPQVIGQIIRYTGESK